MKIYDISVPINPNMATWPGDPPVRMELMASLEQGDDAKVTQLQMSVHTGTHIDAPNHFFANGKTVDQLSFDAFIGEVLVIEIDPSVGFINDLVLKSHSKIEMLKKSTRVLFKTLNSNLWHSHPHMFQTNYVGITTSGAKFLARLNLSLIGLDYLSIAAYKDTIQPHRILLSHDIVLLEGINLSNIPPGLYKLFCAPLLIDGCEGAPSRAFLLQ